MRIDECTKVAYQVLAGQAMNRDQEFAAQAGSETRAAGLLEYFLSPSSVLPETGKLVLKMERLGLEVHVYDLNITPNYYQTRLSGELSRESFMSDQTSGLPALLEHDVRPDNIGYMVYGNRS